MKKFLEDNTEPNLLLNLRDPITHRISVRGSALKFIHMHDKKRLPSDSMFANLFEKIGNNHYVYKILNTYMGIYVKSDEINEEYYQICVNFIEENYFLITILEYFAESIYLLAKVYGWSIDSINYVNEWHSPTNLSKKDLSDELIKQLENDCMYDIRLYEYMKNKLLNQINNLSDTEKRELMDFKKRNEERIKNQKLLAKLGLPSNFERKNGFSTFKTIEYFSSQNILFFNRLKKIIEEENKTKHSGMIKYIDPTIKIEYYQPPFGNYRNNRLPSESEKRFVQSKLKNNTEYVIFGAAFFGEMVINCIEEYNNSHDANIKILYLLDNNIEKNNSINYNYMTYLPTKELVYNKNIIIAAARYYGNIEIQLLNMRVDKEKIINLMSEYKASPVQCERFNPFGYYKNNRSPKESDIIFVQDKLVKNTEYVIFGANDFGCMVIKCIEEFNKMHNANIKILYLLDNNSDKNNSMNYNYMTYLPTSELIHNKNIIISEATNYKDIEMQLLDMGANGKTLINLMLEHKKSMKQIGKVYWVMGKEKLKRIELCKTLKEALDVNSYNYDWTLDIVHIEESLLRLNDYNIEIINSKFCKMLSEQGKTVICSAPISNKVREWNRDNISDYFEVYLKSGEQEEIVDYTQSPDLIIEDNGYYTAEEMAGIIIVKSSDLYRKYKSELEMPN